MVGLCAKRHHMNNSSCSIMRAVIKVHMLKFCCCLSHKKGLLSKCSRHESTKVEHHGSVEEFVNMQGGMEGADAGAGL